MIILYEDGCARPLSSGLGFSRFLLGLFLWKIGVLFDACRQHTKSWLTFVVDTESIVALFQSVGAAVDTPSKCCDMSGYVQLL